MTSSISRRARMRPVAACFRPRTWPISWARTAPRRCRTSSVARSGCERTRCRRCRSSVMSATHGTETRTVADLPSGANAVRPHVGRAADIRITVTLGAVASPLAQAPGPSHGCQSTLTPAVSRSASATCVDPVAIRRIDRSGHEGPHPDAGDSARLSGTSVHRAVDAIRPGNARTTQTKRAVGRQRIEHLRGGGCARCCGGPGARTMAPT